MTIPTHEEMIETFGLPEPKQNIMREVFGWYHCDGHTCYWEYDPKRGSWRILADDNWLKPKFFDVRWNSTDDMAVRRVMETLEFMDTPPIPLVHDKPACGEPFVYEGWIFRHYYFPELKRWHLVPVDRC